MADTPKPNKRRARKSARDTAAKKPGLGLRVLRAVRRVLVWGGGGIAGFVLIWTLLYALINPPTNAYMLSESRRLGGVSQDWVALDRIAPVMIRSAVAAEDANFCLHWGLDVNAIRDAMERGRGGASTISQQVVKNVFLWHGRSWARKSIEALWTPVTEVFWSKRRILEIYLNVAEFDAGVFGVQAAARHYFGVDAADLTATQAARLAAILPAPKERSAANPSSFTRNRAAQILQGAATIAADGRAECFER
ncbi:monofunctional biosynthetic peptidoglycan transglycosylase [Yoonia vestfoldensis]|jgi:monofunctional biosynthetic peptidoglycan transglycosylase|uniref:Biosynthetic peptidoglycan transglycosylase n=1 Tax=Yoonia vestfoldensis TaxID=245188 RepID=A0A1Y0EGD0_9RHOB|nr:monofunctional biosynthetic peptidoglycan transglycosylase [Yoonia vestfoldensis]ARU02644.1 monofunctional biosynthetic peptidoglycan transglycosylase [Yoonia vestfoldensis]